MRTRDPCVSVLIATCNRAHLLGRAIRSVLAQTFEDWELIIVSDGSTDNTANVVSSFQDPRIVFVGNQVNRGFPHARNDGIRRSCGRYISFLDDDDEWLPNKLELQLSVFEAARTEVGLVYCWAEWLNERGERTREKKPTLRGDAFAAMLATQALGPPSSVMIRREVVERVGYLDTEHHYGEDRNYYMRICRAFEVDYVPEVVVRMHSGHERITDGTVRSMASLTEALERRLQLFAEDYARFPNAKAEVLGDLLLRYLQTGRLPAAVGTMGQILACGASPSMSARVIANRGRCWLWYLRKQMKNRHALPQSTHDSASQRVETACNNPGAVSLSRAGGGKT